MNRSNSTHYGTNRPTRSTQTHGRDTDHADYVPPPPDESYWASLLQEDETELPHTRRHDDWHELEASTPGRPFATADDWEIARKVYVEDGVIELPVIGHNRGGLLVEWNALRGFVPASQLLNFPVMPDSSARRAELAARVGISLHLRVIELDILNNRLILSERAAQVAAGTRAQLLDHLQQGDVCSGTVTNLCDFGAFVDLGGVEGLIHISELSWGRVNHPEDILVRGQYVRVHVMEINQEAGRVALSLKRLQPDPWETVERRYTIGQIIEGVITNVVDFGAFTRVEEGLEGLIHISELAEGSFLHPRNVVREGEHVRVRVLNIDGRSRRLGLSLRLYEQPSPYSYGQD
ncbi:MAG TPA: S1 RNA-binding domain-containing protein [Aggregatilineales bacterium]|nr:S1 RNA-binding domain-containing protein [Anaerolineales bacterium]HRE48461.1 S1 RNA-binding domain-containing protein [Aggregatilineales bacterium]